MLSVFLTLAVYVFAGLAATFFAAAVLMRVTERSLLRARLRTAAVQAAGAGGGVSLLGWLMPAAVLQRMRHNFEQRRQAVGLSLSWEAFVVTSLLLGALGFTVGAFYFHNLLAGIVMGALGLLLPDQSLAYGASTHQDRANEQLQLAFQIFAAEYRSNRSVPRAFIATVPQLPEPIRHHFARAARRLNNGEAPKRVLDDLAERLGHPFARMFASNCRAVQENQQSAALFDALAYQLNQWRIRQTQTEAALSGGRLLGLLMNGLLPAIYLVQVRMQPRTYPFLTETSVGRALVILMLLGVLLTFLINRYLARVEW